MRQGRGNGWEQDLGRSDEGLGILIELRRECFSMLAASKDM